MNVKDTDNFCCALCVLSDSDLGSAKLICKINFDNYKLIYLHKVS